MYHYKYDDVTGVSFRNDGKQTGDRERRIRILVYGERDIRTAGKKVGARGQLV